MAADLGLPAEGLEPRGDHVAKIRLDALDPSADLAARQPRATYVLVSAITPTPFGEGKTATAIGLADGLARLGRRPVVTLRQPSMGPTFGIKGGAAGAGLSQVVPMELMNLHLTGDFHAVSAAHNLLAALVDNHLYHGNPLGLHPPTINWPRVVDLNDRALRSIVIGLGGGADGVPRQSGFHITAASEVMAILGLSLSVADLRARLGRIVVGRRRDGGVVTAEDLHGAGAMSVLLRDALQPNLLQTLEGTPVLVHTGPFGNIAHGNSSVVADLVGMGTGDVVITEAGFGTDLGAERFFNIKCRVSGLWPDVAVLVVTVRALKMQSGRYRIVAGRPLPPELSEERPADVAAGAANLARHVANLRRYDISVVVAINVFPHDHPSEINEVAALAAGLGVACTTATHVADGGRGAEALGEAVLRAARPAARPSFLYEPADRLAAKIERIATETYGAASVVLSARAETDLAAAERDGFGSLGVCVAKTHRSLTADPTRLGAPTGWPLEVDEVRVAAGAGFVIARCGEISLMPGLGADPAAHHIDLDPNNVVVGLS